MPTTPTMLLPYPAASNLPTYPPTCKSLRPVSKRCAALQTGRVAGRRREGAGGTIARNRVVEFAYVADHGAVNVTWAAEASPSRCVTTPAATLRRDDPGHGRILRRACPGVSAPPRPHLVSCQDMTTLGTMGQFSLQGRATQNLPMRLARKLTPGGRVAHRSSATGGG